MSDDNKDWLKQDFLDLVSKFGELERKLEAEITEYKKTVNNALGLLSKEFLDFTANDIKERKARQRRQDIKDAILTIIALLLILSLCSMIALLVYFLTQRVVIV